MTKLTQWTQARAFEHTVLEGMRLWCEYLWSALSPELRVFYRSYTPRRGDRHRKFFWHPEDVARDARFSEKEVEQFQVAAEFYRFIHGAAPYEPCTMNRDDASMLFRNLALLRCRMNESGTLADMHHYFFIELAERREIQRQRYVEMCSFMNEPDPLLAIIAEQLVNVQQMVMLGASQEVIDREYAKAGGKPGERTLHERAMHMLTDNFKVSSARVHEIELILFELQQVKWRKALEYLMRHEARMRKCDPDDPIQLPDLVLQRAGFIEMKPRVGKLSVFARDYPEPTEEPFPIISRELIHCDYYTAGALQKAVCPTEARA